ncbi:hypothetical protein TUZN_1558 [Thermoproteus uzoniensis 768-20]|uniref:Uncharacterized protein n=1 Tax=Thermoproteus uzoniensis (strain 768-20) TaxID=999630 RepID=F2L2H8_THEU7|nr:hypothetical protein TUZN_1558 [Thermoproteus uzoniensis 768-20]
MGRYVDVDEVLTKLRERCRAVSGEEPRPTLEAVLEKSARRGVLYGTVDTLFEKWRLYMRYVGEAVPRALSLPDDAATRFRQFVDGLIQLLDRAEGQAREKLTKICRAVEEGRVEVIERSKVVSHICADGVCIHTQLTRAPVFKLPLHDVSAKLYFPSIGLSPEEVEAFQLGWRASDETADKRRPMMATTQPWQLFAWSATRPGWMRVHVVEVGINAGGLSLEIYAVAKDWTQKWSKEEAQRMALEALRGGDYRPLLTWYLGDGVVDGRREKIALSTAVNIEMINGLLGGSYNYRKIELSRRRAKELAKKITTSVGRYGVLLEVLYSHKWVYLKALADYRPSFDPAYVVIKGVVMRLHLSAKTLHAVRYFAEREEAEKALNALKPHAKMYVDRRWYVAYIPWRELKELVKRDPTLREAVARYLAGRNKPATKKLLSQIPLFDTNSVILMKIGWSPGRDLNLIPDPLAGA